MSSWHILVITPSDFIHIPYTPDLTEGGIAYASHSLVHSYNRMGLERLRRMVAGVVVELALRRYLGEQAVPFKVFSTTPFSDPDHYDVSLGGHCSYLQSDLITRRRQISLIRKNPALFMDAHALIPVDQFTAEGRSSQDIYLFAFLLALITASMEDLQKAIKAEQPIHLIHPLPERWARSTQWQPLQSLALKSECERSITVEIGGMDAGRNFVTTCLDLPSHERIPVTDALYSVAYIHIKRSPEARLGIHSPTHGEVYIIQPHEWSNIWVYGMDIWLTGWLTHEEYRRKASVLPAGNHTFQYDRTHAKNLAVPMTDLNPLGGLFERIRQWAATRADN